MVDRAQQEFGGGEPILEPTVHTSKQNFPTFFESRKWKMGPARVLQPDLNRNVCHYQRLTRIPNCYHWAANLYSSSGSNYKLLKAGNQYDSAIDGHSKQWIPSGRCTGNNFGSGDSLCMKNFTPYYIMCKA